MKKKKDAAKTVENWKPGDIRKDNSDHKWKIVKISSSYDKDIAKYDSTGAAEDQIEIMEPGDKLVAVIGADADSEGEKAVWITSKGSDTLGM